MTSRRANHTLQIFGGLDYNSLVCVGGYNGHELLRSTETCDLSQLAREWRQFGNMSCGRKKPVLVQAGNDIYVFGGTEKTSIERRSMLSEAGWEIVPGPKHALPPLVRCGYTSDGVYIFGGSLKRGCITLKNWHDDSARDIEYQKQTLKTLISDFNLTTTQRYKECPCALSSWNASAQSHSLH